MAVGDLVARIRVALDGQSVAESAKEVEDELTEAGERSAAKWKAAFGAAVGAALQLLDEAEARAARLVALTGREEQADLESFASLLGSGIGGEAAGAGVQQAVTALRLTGAPAESAAQTLGQAERLAPGSADDLVTAATRLGVAGADAPGTAAEQAGALNQLANITFARAQARGIDEGAFVSEFAEQAATFAASGLPWQTGLELLADYSRLGNVSELQSALEFYSESDYARRTGGPSRAGLAATFGQIRDLPEAEARLLTDTAFGNINFYDAIRNQQIDVVGPQADLDIPEGTLGLSAFRPTSRQQFTGRVDQLALTGDPVQRASAAALGLAGDLPLIGGAVEQLGGQLLRLTGGARYDQTPVVVINVQAPLASEQSAAAAVAAAVQSLSTPGTVTTGGRRLEPHG